MTPGQVVEVGRNDCAVPPGTRGVWLGTVPETGCALVLLPGGRRVSLLAEQWRVEGGEWAGPRTLAAEPAVARPAPVPRLTARPVPRPRTTAKPTRVCTVEGCDRTVRARGWCRAHYRRWLATGDVRPDEPVGSRHGPASRTCSVPGCDRTHVARGLCATHYSRGQRRGFGADLSSRPPTSPAVCTVPGCGREHHGRGLCRMHYSRLRRTGSTGEATPRKWPAREAA